DNFIYPVTHYQAEEWLSDFIEKRIIKFGDYEDAISDRSAFLFHSVLTPALNIGLLTPQQVIEEIMKNHEKTPIPLNSLEGFIRQVIGWREFMRGIYRYKGTYQRKHNFFGHSRKIPESFWNGNTGIDPLDDVIKKVNQHAYAHHIERLMVLGNFMLLCEFDPDEVYQWFMELFIDAYDWVMVPNVYGMTQYADGGLITTKPYISSSNYIRKMSNYGKGEWSEIWDGLYWRFLHIHRDKFENNQRMNMMMSILDRMDQEKLEAHLEVADNFLGSLRK
ncbi:MAG: FAD-binding domain-containing protein, partial [Cyclobacteriaceae bacterium]